MSQYKPCPDCGAHLDPGERCDCNEKEPVYQHKPLAVRVCTNQKQQRKYTTIQRNEQMMYAALQDWLNT